MERFNVPLITSATQMDVAARAKEVGIAPIVYPCVAVSTDINYRHGHLIQAGG
jgi:hypothetical protein